MGNADFMKYKIALMLIYYRIRIICFDIIEV